ncbi:MAG: acyl-CoA mutase large subunit family protein [Bacteroidetes bacterium]|nr:acyl-CoA mutase large subunit family protein [Bacteroidota bacterium]MBL7102958.1 acyl-CoA mutase large subunit family protein [Bacteroidales bacterium]
MSKDNKLFSEFPPISTEQWEEKINQDLKDADYDKKLVWKTIEGFDVKPYYRKENSEYLKHQDVFPGDFPFIRGNKKTGNDWYIRQDIYVDDIEKANKKALDILMKGVNSLGFIFDKKFEPSKKNIEQVTENIFADAVELNFICFHNSINVVRYVDELVKKYNRDLDKIYGSVDFDPLGQFALKGKFPVSAEASFDLAKKMIESGAHLPHFRVITVNANYFHNSGASIVEELAFGLAQGTNYLTRLTDRGLSIDKVAPKLKFHFAVGSNYFMEIAKIRAARLLWAHIVKGYGLSRDSVAQMFIHSTTSNWNKTVYDAYVNMLRTTTESMSSIIGGTDSLTVNPFNSVFEKPNDFSERIARSQQLLLKEESYLDKVIDPAAGSYYIESLTDSIADQAWKLFLEVQEKGSFLEAFKAGFIQAKISETAHKRDMAIATRKEILLGTNQYPNFTEYLDKEVDSSVFKPENHSEDDAEVKTLKPYRSGQAFGELRYKTDRYAKSGKRPKVFLITIGNITIRRARAQFASNFFACAGFEVVDNAGFKRVNEAVQACLDAKAEIAVVCSSDEEYAELVPKFYNSLKDNVILVVDGYPKAIIEDLKQKGIKHFIHIRSNVLKTLREFQEMLEII